MAIFVVMQPSGVQQDPAAAAVLVRDGFSWPAFLVPPLWLLWHRLWIEASLAFAIGVAVSALGEGAGLGVGSAALSLLVSTFVGLEGAALRINALRRRGWHEWGVVEAHDAGEAEIRFAAEAEPQASMMAPTPMTDRSVLAGRPAHAGAALGLLGYSGRH